MSIIEIRLALMTALDPFKKAHNGVSPRVPGARPLRHFGGLADGDRINRMCSPVKPAGRSSLLRSNPVADGIVPMPGPSSQHRQYAAQGAMIK